MLTEFQTRKLLKLFSMYDADHDGFLVKKDFSDIAKKLANLRNWGLRSPRYLAIDSQLTQNWKCLEGEADTDGDHRVSIDEWLAFYDSVLSDPQKYEQRVKKLMDLVFEVFDTDGDGLISKSEWSNLLVVYNVCAVYGERSFDALDTNHDGYLNQTEMLSLLEDFYYSEDPQNPANSMFGPY
ncbi:MAG: EF-hand domain-containing protein [Cyanobacteria bacterium P01_H01_bin.15]